MARRTVGETDYLKPIPFCAVAGIRGFWAGKFSGGFYVDRIKRGTHEEFLRRVEALERKAAAEMHEVEMA